MADRPIGTTIAAAREEVADGNDDRAARLVLDQALADVAGIALIEDRAAVLAQIGTALAMLAVGRQVFDVEEALNRG